MASNKRKAGLIEIVEIVSWPREVNRADVFSLLAPPPSPLEGRKEVEKKEGMSSQTISRLRLWEYFLFNF
jgi:hypothetical protein